MNKNIYYYVHEDVRVQVRWNTIILLSSRGKKKAQMYICRNENNKY